MGFCFLMFSNIDSGTKLVHDAYVNPISIDGKYLSITYSHPNSFVPVCGSSEWITYSYLDTEYLLVEIAYWDEQYYAKEYPKSPPIDPSFIKGKWVPPDVPEIQNDQVDQDAPTTEITNVITVVKEPVIYNQLEESNQGNEEDSLEDSHSHKKPKILDPKDKTSLQFMKWQERQEELSQPMDTISLSEEELKKVLV